MKWIWFSDKRRNWNEWVQFRRDFLLEDVPERAFLKVTADARYRIYVNGHWVGQGPIRGYPDNWHFDVHDITRLLKQGPNHICAEVQSVGICTFQYIISDAGFALELVADGETLVESDDEWECRRDPAVHPRRFRISCQQAWQEVRRIRCDEHKGWVRATLVEEPRKCSAAPVGMEVMEVVEPKAALWSHPVRPPATVWSLALREYLLPGYSDASPAEICGLVAAVFHVKHAADLNFELTGSWFWVQAPGRLNGEELAREESNHNRWQNGIRLSGTAQPGENLVIFDVSGHFHEWHLTVTEDDAVLEGVRFFVAGPFTGHDDPEKQRLWDATESSEWLSSGAKEPDAEAHVALETAFASTAYARRAGEEIEVNPHNVALREGSPHQVCLDLGRMCVGYWEFEIEAKAPAKLFVNGFEAMQDGVPDYCWEMSNTIELHLEPGTYRYRSPQRRGGRYIVIQGSGIAVRSFRVHEETYPSRAPAPFQSSDKMLDRIYVACALTTRLCSEDTFVDCPTYEQTFWVGDSRNEALINYAVFGDWPLARRCWELAAESLSRSPLVESHVPSGWPNIIPAWSFLWAMGCWEYYFYTGDRDFIERIYPLMKLQLANCDKYLDADGLFSIEAWNLCDWAAMDQPGRGVVTHNQGWLALSAQATAMAAQVTGDLDGMSFAAEFNERISSAVNECLWNDERKAFTDCKDFETGKHSSIYSIQTQVVLSLAGIPSEARQARLDSLITGKDDSTGFVQVGSPFFMFFLMEYIETLGEHERILELIREHWGMMLDRGATTCWEVFPGFMHNGRWTRSHCHAWSAAPAYFLSRLALGIVPADTAFRKVQFDPKLRLDWCRGAVPTPRGLIEVEWDSRGERKVSAPQSVEVNK